MTTLPVFPHTDRVDDVTVDRLPRSSHAIAAVGRVATTVRQLEDTLSRTALGDRRPLSGLARSLAMALVLAQHLPEPFAAVAQKPGFRRAVERLWKEVAAGACEVQELAAAAAHLGGALADRVRALASVLARYQVRLDELDLADPDAMLGAATRMLERGAPVPQELAVDLVRVEDVVDWPPSRLAWVRALGDALARRGGRVEVVLPDSDAPELADVVDPVWRSLEALSEGVQPERRPLRWLRSARVHGFTAGTAGAELTEVARRVHALLEQGVPASHIAIASRGIADLANLIERVCAAAGVPVRNRRGRSLLASSTARLALELARLQGARGTTAKRVGAVVGSYLVDLRGVEPGAPGPPVLARLLREAHVRDRALESDDLDGFASRLERLARAREHDQDPRGADEARRARQAFAAFFAELDLWPDRASFRRHGRELVRLLDRLRVPNRLRRLSFRPPTAGASLPDAMDRLQSSQLAHEQAVWSRLPTALSDLSDAARSLGGEDEVVSRADFASWLEERLGAESIRPASARGVSVEVAELADLAGRTVEHLFVVGAYDGRLPGTPAIDPLLSDDDRWRLNAALGRPVFRVPPRGVERSPLPTRQLAQALEFALALEAASNVTLSRPRADDRGRPLAPSPLAALVGATEEHLPFRPLDGALASRSSQSIADRRRAAVERARFFAGGNGAVFDGDASPVGEALRAFVPGTAERPLSAGGAERAAACRFRHFAEVLLGARPPPETGDDAGPMESGRLAHLAAESAVRAIVGRGWWAPDRRQDALEVGIAAAALTLDAEEPHTVLGSPDLWAIQRRKMLGRLRRMLELEIDRTALVGMKPCFLELDFGRAGTPVPTVMLGDVHLAGKIDRVDTGPAGTSVLDYKSGAAEAMASRLRSDALLVTQFQLPFYVVAAKALAEGPADAVYVSLRDGERSKTLFEAAKTSWPELEGRLEDEIGTLVEALARADFSPRPRTCRGCHLRPVCRIPRPEAA